MEVQKGKGGIYPQAFFVMLMLLINAYYCAGAVVLVKSNATTVRYDDRLQESLIEYDLEFLMNPYISRMLGDDQPSGSVYSTESAGHPACQPPSPCSGGGTCGSVYQRTCPKSAH